MTWTPVAITGGEAKRVFSMPLEDTPSPAAGPEPATLQRTQSHDGDAQEHSPLADELHTPDTALVARSALAQSSVTPHLTRTATPAPQAPPAAEVAQGAASAAAPCVQAETSSDRTPPSSQQLPLTAGTTLSPYGHVPAAGPPLAAHAGSTAAAPPPNARLRRPCNIPTAPHADRNVGAHGGAKAPNATLLRPQSGPSARPAPACAHVLSRVSTGASSALAAFGSTAAFVTAGSGIASTRHAVQDVGLASLEPLHSSAAEAAQQQQSVHLQQQTATATSQEGSDVWGTGSPSCAIGYPVDFATQQHYQRTAPSHSNVQPSPLSAQSSGADAARGMQGRARNMPLAARSAAQRRAPLPSTRRGADPSGYLAEASRSMFWSDSCTPTPERSPNNPSATLQATPAAATDSTVPAGTPADTPESAAPVDPRDTASVDGALSHGQAGRMRSASSCAAFPIAQVRLSSGVHSWHSEQAHTRSPSLTPALSRASSRNSTLLSGQAALLQAANACTFLYSGLPQRRHSETTAQVAQRRGSHRTQTARQSLHSLHTVAARAPELRRSASADSVHSSVASGGLDAVLGDVTNKSTRRSGSEARAAISAHVSSSPRKTAAGVPQHSAVAAVHDAGSSAGASGAEGQAAHADRARADAARRQVLGATASLPSPPEATNAAVATGALAGNSPTDSLDALSSRVQGTLSAGAALAQHTSIDAQHAQHAQQQRSAAAASARGAAPLRMTPRTPLTTGDFDTAELRAEVSEHMDATPDGHGSADARDAVASAGVATPVDASAGQREWPPGLAHVPKITLSMLLTSCSGASTDRMSRNSMFTPRQMYTCVPPRRHIFGAGLRQVSRPHRASNAGSATARSTASGALLHSIGADAAMSTGAESARAAPVGTGAPEASVPSVGTGVQLPHQRQSGSVSARQMPAQMRDASGDRLADSAPVLSAAQQQHVEQPPPAADPDAGPPLPPPAAQPRQASADAGASKRAPLVLPSVGEGDTCNPVEASPVSVALHSHSGSHALRSHSGSHAQRPSASVSLVWRQCCSIVVRQKRPCTQPFRACFALELNIAACCTAVLQSVVWWIIVMYTFKSSCGLCRQLCRS